MSESKHASLGLNGMDCQATTYLGAYSRENESSNENKIGHRANYELHS